MHLNIKHSFSVMLATQKFLHIDKISQDLHLSGKWYLLIKEKFTPLSILPTIVSPYGHSIKSPANVKLYTLELQHLTPDCGFLPNHLVLNVYKTDKSFIGTPILYCIISSSSNLANCVIYNLAEARSISLLGLSEV